MSGIAIALLIVTVFLFGMGFMAYLIADQWASHCAEPGSEDESNGS